MSIEIQELEHDISVLTREIEAAGYEERVFLEETKSYCLMKLNAFKNAHLAE